MSRPDRTQAAWAVFGLALAVRALWCLSQGLPVPVVGDALEYHDYAKNLVEQGAFIGPYGDFATRMPGYPLLLAAIRLVFGGSLAAVLAVQCVLGAATCVLLQRLAARLLPEPWPLVAGLLAAVHFGLFSPSAYLLSEGAYSFFLVLALWCLYNEDWTPARRALSYGAAAGFLYLVRPEGLPWIVATAAGLPLLWKKFHARQAVLALAAFGLIAGLWVGRNFAYFGKLLPATTVGKSVGYLSLFLPAEQFGWTPEGRQVASAGLGELERDAYYAGTWTALRERLSAVQLVRAYSYNLLSILYPFLPCYDWTYVFLLPFLALGLFLARERRWLPVAAAALCSIGVLVFFGGPASRYRQGVSPLLILLAAHGMSAAYGRSRERFRNWTGGWLAANLLLWAFSPLARRLALRVKEAITG